MNLLTIEWIEKAEGDLLTARREFRARKLPNFDAVCFHAQQAAEKYIKAILQEYEIPIPRSHNLADLLALIIKCDSDFDQMQGDAVVLEGYAIQFRYPGLSANKEDAKAALQAADRVCAIIRKQLGLKNQSGL